MDEGPAFSSDIVELNAGGHHIDVSRQTLLLLPECSPLRMMFAGGWDGNPYELDKNGRIFLDVPPQAFACIVDYLRLLRLAPKGSPPPYPAVEPPLRQDFETLAAFLG